MENWKQPQASSRTSVRALGKHEREGLFFNSQDEQL